MSLELVAVVVLSFEELYFSMTAPLRLSSALKSKASIPPISTLTCFKFVNKPTSFSNNNFTSAFALLVFSL